MLVNTCTCRAYDNLYCMGENYSVDSEYSCSAKVAGLTEILVQGNFLALELHMPLIFTNTETQNE